MTGHTTSHHDAAIRHHPPGGTLISRTTTTPVALFFVLPGLALLLAASIPGPTLHRGHNADGAEVGRILRFLTDDRLRGRGSFTPGNEEAARFIASEFASAGLRPAPGSDSLMQWYRVHRVMRESLSVVLNGGSVPGEDLIISTELDRGEWVLGDSFPAVMMGEEFDRGLFRRTDRVILVPRIHEKIFREYKSYFDRPAMYAGEPRRGLLAAILTDAPGAQTCSITLRGRTETPSLVNVVGIVPGRRPEEIVLFSAHYDHLGVIQPVDGDSIANGADDDASGITALIGLAKHFASGETPGRTLMFAAFAAEEIGGFGSRHLLESLTPGTIAAMINLEMLGTVSKFGPRTFWLTGYDRSSLGEMISAALKGSPYTIHPDPYPQENLFFRSDNAVFARAGVPAHTISTTRIDVDSFYHTVNDEFARIDTVHLAAIIDGIARGVRGLVDGTQTPDRIPVR